MLRDSKLSTLASMGNNQPESRFSWLLFSDLQCREDDETKGPWSERFKQGLWEDLGRLHEEAGPFDAVFFAGDFAYCARDSEYEICSGLLTEMFDHLRAMGPTPAMFCVPGNHDLVRSSETELASIIHPDTWFGGVADSIEGDVRSAFRPYQSWARRWLFPEVKAGVWPGDFVARTRDDASGGVMGLNTALNQGGLVNRDIPLDIRRLDLLSGASLEKWAGDKRLRFLLTHHPPGLFHYGPAERTLPLGDKGFQIHLCGHSQSDFAWSYPPGDSSVLIQAPRLRPTGEREIGYVAGLVDYENLSEVSIWARAFSLAQESWQQAHQLQHVFHVPLPASKLQPGRPRNVSRQIAASNEPIYVESLHLAGFRCFDRLDLTFRHETQLAGEWTCLAGINGAGKSSILQAVCLGLLGDQLVRELGGERLNRMRRMVDGERRRAEIEIVLRPAGVDRRISLRLAIDANGDTEAESSVADFWQELRSRVIVGYGATRNLSSRVESGYESLSADVRRQITLFDPLSQLAGADVLLRQQASTGPVSSLFQSIVRQVFEADLQIEVGREGIRFTGAGKDYVEAVDLPDGFRASAAWIADLCAIWCDKAPEAAGSGDPSDIHGIVLIDEIDLHLHPTLQRKLVPKLRSALPRVQWIVTTHSPLVLANFDSHEIIALDRDREGNVRPLDRQILGFSSDQIYEWLMETTPTGEAIEQVLEKNETNGQPTDDEIAELLDTSPRVNDADAHKRVQKLKGAIERLKP